MKLSFKHWGVNMYYVRLITFFVSLCAATLGGWLGEYTQLSAGIVLLFGTIVQVALALVHALMSKQERFVIHWFDIVFGVSVLVYALAWYASPSSLVGLLGSYRFFTHSVAHFALLFVLYMSLKSVFRNVDVSRIFAGLSLALIPSVIYALVGRVMSIPTITDQNFSGIFVTLLFIIIGLWGYALAKRLRSAMAVASVVTALVFVGAIITQLPFAFALVMFVIGSALLLISYTDETGKLQKPLLWIASALAVMVIGINYFGSFLENNPRLMDVTLPHFSAVEIASQALQTYPFTGVGVEKFVDAFFMWYPKSLGLSIFDGQIFFQSSSLILELIVTTGVVGTIAMYAPLLVVVVLAGIRLKQLRATLMNVRTTQTYVSVALIGIIVMMLASFVYPVTSAHLIVGVVMMLLVLSSFEKETMFVSKNYFKASLAFMSLMTIATLVGGVLYTRSAVALAKGTPRQEDCALLAYDVYAKFTCAYIDLQNNPEQAVTRLQELSALPSLSYDILTALSYINAQLQAYGQVEVTDSSLLSARMDALFPHNPEKLYAQSVQTLTNEGILNEGGLRKQSYAYTSDTKSVAHETINEFIEYKPYSFVGYFLKGLAFEVDLDLPSATQEYIKALSLEPTQQEVVYALLEVLIAQERFEEAKSIAQRYAQDNQEDARLIEIQKKIQ